MSRIVSRLPFCFSLALNIAFIIFFLIGIFEPDIRGFFMGDVTLGAQGCRLRCEDYELWYGNVCNTNDFEFSAKTENGNVRWTHRREIEPGGSYEEGITYNSILANGISINWKQDRSRRCFCVSLMYDHFSYYDRDGSAKRLVLSGGQFGNNRWLRVVDLPGESNSVQRVEPKAGSSTNESENARTQ